MPQQTLASAENTEYRYDPAMLQKVTVLASRLQQEHKETLTAQEMEAIGVEVGLEPTFVRQALAQLEQAQIASVVRTKTRIRSTAGKGEFYAAVLALTFPLAWGTLAFLLTHATLGSDSLVTEATKTLALFFSVVAPGPLIALQGFLTGKPRLGELSGVTLALALAVTFPYAVASQGQVYGACGLPYVVLGAGIFALFGNLGAKLRATYFPLPSKAPSLEATAPAGVDEAGV